ncbi:MAG: hypothetical protein ABEK04_00290 [Candidatus Nanohalobium sp.]
MSGKVVIRQLWDKQKEKTPTVNDVDRNLLTDKKTWNYQGRKYATYRNKDDKQPYDNEDTVTWKNLTENGRYKIPVKFIKRSDGSRERTVNHPKLLHDMVKLREKFDKLGGEGYYNIYIIGGRNPPLKYILQRWISQN